MTCSPCLLNLTYAEVKPLCLWPRSLCALKWTHRPGWDAAGPLMALVVAGTQTGASFGFAAVIERAATVYEKEIAALPIDEEVG